MSALSAVNEAPARKRAHNPKPLPNIDTLPAATPLTRRQLSEMTGWSIVTLKRWAKENRGPRITVLERRPRYRADHVREWLAGQ